MVDKEGEIDLSAAPFPWQQQQWRQLLGQFQADRLAHATLVWGESGLGKTEFVSSFSGLMLCRQPSAERACGSCKSCLLVKSNSHPDLQLLAPEAGSKEIKIDQVRAVTGFVNRTSHAGGAKIVIIKRKGYHCPAVLLSKLHDDSCFGVTRIQYDWFQCHGLPSA